MHFLCFDCGYTSEYKTNLRRHIENNHIKPNNNYRQTCMMCDYKGPSRPFMKQHYAKVHNVDISVQNYQFVDTQSFVQWKSCTETSDLSQYIKLRAPRRNKTTINQTYICHRDGHFIAKGKGMRRVKKLGSNKINGSCPSEMIVTTDLLSGAVTVKYIKTHVGHTLDLERLCFSNSDRNTIAQKLCAGLGHEQIIGSIRDSLSKDSKSRLHLVTRQDVANVSRDFKINASVVRHSSDVISVDAWDSEQQESSNTVRFYKPQESTGNHCFEKKMKVAEELWLSIKSQCKKSSDIDIIIAHLKPILPTILAANSQSNDFSVASSSIDKPGNPNKNITPQMRFTSSKKCRIIKKNLFCKPSSSEEQSILANWFFQPAENQKVDVHKLP